MKTAPSRELEDFKPDNVPTPLWVVRGTPVGLGEALEAAAGSCRTHLHGR